MKEYTYLNETQRYHFFEGYYYPQHLNNPLFLGGSENEVWAWGFYHRSANVLWRFKTEHGVLRFFAEHPQNPLELERLQQFTLTRFYDALAVWIAWELPVFETVFATREEHNLYRDLFDRAYRFFQDDESYCSVGVDTLVDESDCSIEVDYLS